MADEKENVKVGKKIEPADAAKLDPATVKKAIGEPVPEVEGQYLYVDYIGCPWCGNVIRMQLSSTYAVPWNCQSCGGYYTA